MSFAMLPKQEDADAQAIALLLKKEEKDLADHLYRFHFKKEEEAALYDYGPPVPAKAEVKAEVTEEVTEDENKEIEDIGDIKDGKIEGAE